MTVDHSTSACSCRLPPKLYPQVQTSSKTWIPTSITQHPYRINEYEQFDLHCEWVHPKLRVAGQINSEHAELIEHGAASCDSHFRSEPIGEVVVADERRLVSEQCRCRLVWMRRCIVRLGVVFLCHYTI